MIWQREKCTAKNTHSRTFFFFFFQIGVAKRDSETTVDSIYLEILWVSEVLHNRNGDYKAGHYYAKLVRIIMIEKF